MKQTVKHGFEISDVKLALDANAFSAATTTYYLLLQKHLREGGFSPADLTAAKLENIQFSNRAFEKRSGRDRNNSVDTRKAHHHQPKEKREKSLSINNYLNGGGADNNEEAKRSRTANYSFDLHTILMKSIKGAESKIEKSKVYSKADHVLRRQIEQTFKTNQPKSKLAITRIEGRPGISSTKRPSSRESRNPFIDEKSSLREKITRRTEGGSRFSTTPIKDLRHVTDRRREELEARIRSRVSSEREASAHRKHKSSVERSSFIDDALKKNSLIRAQIERRNKGSVDFTPTPKGKPDTQWLQYLERKLRSKR